jgi:hypothetical protein
MTVGPDLDVKLWSRWEDRNEFGTRAASLIDGRVPFRFQGREESRGVKDTGKRGGRCGCLGRTKRLEYAA